MRTVIASAIQLPDEQKASALSRRVEGLVHALHTGPFGMNLSRGNAAQCLRRSAQLAIHRHDGEHARLSFGDVHMLDAIARLCGNRGKSGDRFRCVWQTMVAAAHLRS